MASKGAAPRLRTARAPKRADKSPHNFMERLPCEILIKILSSLDASALFSISHVSKLFYQLANDNALWNKIYTAEFGKNGKCRHRCMDKLLLKMTSVELRDCAAGHWKWLFFTTVGVCELNKWKRNLGLIRQYTGLPSRTEWALRNLHVTWELTVSDKSGQENTLELSRSQFCETSAYMCWGGGDCLPNYQHISTLQLHGVRRINLICPGLKSPGWRSLMAKLDMQTLTESAEVIGQDQLVELKLLHPGVVIGTWRDQSSIAFIMFTLHFHKLLERSIQGSSVCPYLELMAKPPSDDADPEYGLHGYQLHIVLHNTVCSLMSGSFSELFCLRSQISDAHIELTAISRTNLSQHTPLTGSITLPWRCEVLKSAVENCCIMSVTLLDEFRKPFWCVSSPVFMEPGNAAVSYDYDGEHFLIHYRDSDGRVKIELAWVKEQEQYVVIGLVVYVSVSKVNEHFGRDY
ncbi:F-box only protein 15 [Solea senegalensis]|uniref:F-box only protein 15 n=1 Tax=Solea senegalensis TaxID=28829 RepID=A0AAV6T940_SOLSE|nr:F-box only protein 15 isoform X1 [Solea senegalensis]XP_043889145.1 F-box only protein 15 isoform X1 [Solea senegalensis]XP_043889153.1 F-box only protein 15 isoform X1 [Solea senegalensis]XP_043889159.1 F-box only protein 15 isoform X1 [Solea senegalensis]XP_043889167.1 F-box only protein 15 isoform X1 [Solea senegalensis]KAG7525867.1 F-box only protein 15 [Solea senegalensis]